MVKIRGVVGIMKDEGICGFERSGFEKVRLRAWGIYRDFTPEALKPNA